MTSRLALAIVISLTAGAGAQPAPARHASFEGKITAIGAALPILCGVVMVTQDVTLTISKVQNGPLKIGDKPTIRVLSCFGGKLLRPIATAKAPVFELDRGQIHVGSTVQVDVEDLAHDAWFTTTDKIVVR